MYKSSRVHQRESNYKVAKCIYHHVCITRKAVEKLGKVYIITCDHKKSWYKVVECTYHQVCITRKVPVKLQNVNILPRLHLRKVVTKLRNAYIITCSSQRKL